MGGIVAIFCSVIVVGSMSCGGGGSAEVVPAPTPGFSLSSTALKFANQNVGATSSPLRVTLTNVGNTTLTLSNVQVTGSAAADFKLTNNCGSSLSASAQCTLTASFSPSAAGTRTASVVFTDDASGSPQTLNLDGTGTAPGLTLSATTLTFDSQVVGTTSAPQTLTLTNDGNAVLGMSSLNVIGANPVDFPETTNCGTAIPSGGSCTVSVTFRPTASGSRTASVSISDNASGNPQVVSLTGTGTAPTPAATPTLSIPSGTYSSAQAVTISDATTGATIYYTTNGSTPSTSSTKYTGAITVSSSETLEAIATASGYSTSAVASATYTISVPNASLSPASLSFGSEAIAITSAVQTITLTNSGTAALSISGITLAGANVADFAEIADTCGSSVAAGGNCTIGVTFTPSLAGSETATISISDNGPSSPQTVSLSGTGTPDVILSWTASSSSGLVGYNVYRGTTSGGESTTPLNSTPISGTTYVDVNVTAGQTYYYFLMSVSSGGELSAPSSETAATVPAS